MNESGVRSRTQKLRVSSKKLSERLKISLDMDQKIIQATTKLAVRKIEEPSLKRKFITNDHTLQYARLDCDTFMDNFF